MDAGRLEPHPSAGMIDIDFRLLHRHGAPDLQAFTQFSEHMPRFRCRTSSHFRCCLNTRIGV